MFFQEDGLNVVELYDGAFAVSEITNEDPPLVLGFMEKTPRYTSDNHCPECDAKRTSNECPRCGLRVVECCDCKCKSYVVCKPGCIREECGNTYLP